MADKLNLTQTLYSRAKEIFPNGTQLLSKQPEQMAPGQWPAYFARAKGYDVWDLDGKHYYDMSTNGIGSCLLGYAHPEVNEGVLLRVQQGSMSTLNAPEEVELAERLIALHPWAEKARLARTGGEICSVAIRIARATTDRSKVAVCGYHGWGDWYLAANLGDDDTLRGHLLPGLDPMGVPRELRGTTLAFQYGDIAAFDQLMDAEGDKLAAVIMEPVRYALPPKGFLEHVRAETKKRGIVLIFDEITIGFRLATAGSHMRLGVEPDLAVFAKALGNGCPIAAVIGTGAAMEGAYNSFISSTYWTESIGPTAGCRVLDFVQRHDVPAHVARMGARVLDIWEENANKHGVDLNVERSEYTCLVHAAFKGPQATELRTLYTQKMLERSFLAPLNFYPTYAHDDEVLALYTSAADEVFGEIALAIRKDRVKEELRGPAAHSGFKRLN